MTDAQLAETSRAAVFHAAGQPLQLQQFAVPAPQAGEAVVRVACCTICGSDLHTISGARREAAPSILGHEIVGDVERLGDPPPCDIDGRPLRLGDRVTWSTSVSCQRCDRCRQGIPQKCRQLAKYGHEQAEGREALSGGLAERILLRPGSTIISVAGIPDVVASPASCATATVAAAVRAAEPLPNARVLILGAGMLGLTAAAMAKTRGAAEVSVSDIDAGRRERAAEFGADSALAEIDEAAQFDAILELSGSPDAVERACAAGDIGARVVLVGSVKPSRPVSIDPEQVVRRLLTIRGVHNYNPRDLKAAVEFLRQFHDRFPFADLVPPAYSLQDVNRAIEYAVQQRPVRVAVRPFGVR